MTEEQQSLLDELTKYYRNFNARSFLRLGNDTYSLAILDPHFSESLAWVKRLFNNGVYLRQLPKQDLANAIGAASDLRNSISKVERMREDDPTAFLRQKDAIVDEFEQRYASLYSAIIVPLRSYLALNRGNVSEISEAAESSLEKAQQIESNIKEAAGEVASSSSSVYYDELAEAYGKIKKRWLIGFFVYIAVWTILYLLLWHYSDGFKDSFESFDLDNTPAYVFKIVMVGLFVYGLTFIAKNYTAFAGVQINAHTRSTRLKTWNVFAESPALNDDATAAATKAEIAKGVAAIMFSDIATGLDKNRGGLPDNPFGIRSKD